MIDSLYQINSALVNLSQQLSNKQTSNQTIKRCIHKLVEEVRFLDEKEKYHYYLLISQIYATRFQNIQEAEAELKQFGKTLDSEISMNCELRIAFFKYFQQNYKDALKHLDLALGEVQEQLKLIDNAKFFFNRVFNKQHLISQSQDKHNYESGFILSLIYEQQKEHIQALKQIQSFLDQSNDSFKKFQIYKRLLKLYQSMRKNSISTICISKKSLETYRQDLTHLQNKYPHFEENYQFKTKFVNRIINFNQTKESPNSQKLMKKMLDFKLLACYKLKKCSKQASTIQIKKALQGTAQLIRMSKETELLQNILNYDFIKKEYEIFKVFYKPSILKKLANLKLFNSLCNFQPGQMPPRNVPSSTEPVENMPQRSVFSKKPKGIMFEQEQEYDAPLPLSSNKYTPKTNRNEQPQLYTFKPNTSILKNPTQFQNTAQDSVIPIKETESDILDIDDFSGSKLFKFNATSSGHEERYFYVIPQKLTDKPKLYYCMSEKSKSSSDSYYSLKGLKKILVGKQTDTLRRKDAQKFSESQCFALLFDDGKDRSFYVPNEDDLQKWVILLQTKVLYTDSNIDKMTKTMGFKQEGYKNSNINRSSPGIKKSRRVLDI